MGRTDRFARRQLLADSKAIGIEVVVDDSVAPPVELLGDLNVAKTKPQTDNDDAQRSTDIEGTRQNVGIARPPARIHTTDDPVENETNNAPLGQVPGGGRRNHTGGAEEGREDDVAESRARIAAGKEVLDDGAQEANQPEVVAPGVQLTSTENELGTNDTPDDGGVVESTGAGAGQTLGLIGRADLVNVAEEEVVRADLNNGQPDDGKSLSLEHAARRNLHVVANLHVRNVVETVIAQHVTPRLEQHHGNRAARKHVTEDHLSDNVETGLLVGNGLYHTNGNVENGTDENSNDVGPPGQVSLPNL